METLTMGGYGAYVWTSFGLTLAVLIVSTWQARRRHERVKAQIRTKLKAMESES